MSLRQVPEGLKFNSRDIAALVRELDRILKELGYTINKMIEPTTPYTSSGSSVDRTFNAGSATTGEVANVLATLISDLQAKGIIS